MKVLPAAVAVPSSHAAAASGQVSRANVDFKTSSPCAPGVLKISIVYENMLTHHLRVDNPMASCTMPHPPHELAISCVFINWISFIDLSAFSECSDSSSAIGPGNGITTGCSGTSRLIANFCLGQTMSDIILINIGASSCARSRSCPFSITTCHRAL